MKTETKKSKLIETKKELNKYKKAFFILNEYIDSISDEEQVKVLKQLSKIFK